MPKITLDQLAKTAQAKTITPKPVKADMTEMLNQLAEENPEEIKKREEEKAEKMPEVLEDALSGMYETIERKKKEATEMLEETKRVIEQNAAEIAMENEFGDEFEKENEESTEAGIEPEEELSMPELPVVDESEDGDEVFEEENKVFEEAPDLPAVEEVIEEQPVVKPVAEKPVKKTKPVENKTGDSLITDLINDIDSELEESTELPDVDEDMDDIESTSEARRRFKESMKNIKISKDNLDLSKFTIATEPVSSLSIMSDIHNKATDKRTADWGLHRSGRSITLEEASGKELEVLYNRLNNSNGINSTIISMRHIYNHIVDANKPPFETWCKMTYAEDMEDMYFAEYLACFGNANFVDRMCNKCKKGSIVEIPDPAEAFVEYESDEVEEQFAQIRAQETTTSSFKVKSELRVISDYIAISIAPATIYTMYVQFSSLSNEMINKYSDYLDAVASITGYYYIDRESNTLKPIKIPTYKNSIKNTVLSKIKIFADVVSTLNSDQYNSLMGYIRSETNKIQDPVKVKYKIPKCKCPLCGEDIPETRITATNDEMPSVLTLIFQRAQLALINGISED